MPTRTALPDRSQRLSEKLRNRLTSSSFAALRCQCQVKALKTLLIFNFSDSTWSSGPPMKEARRFPGICKLPDGSIVVTGGQSSTGQPLKSAERFFPQHGSNGRWSPLPDLTAGRYAHASTLLPDGRVGVFASHTRSRACEALDVDEGAISGHPRGNSGRLSVIYR